MDIQLSFPNAEKFGSAYANLVHVHSAEKRDACAVLDTSGPTLKKWLAAVERDWIEARKGGPAIKPPPAWFGILHGKMLNATRDPRSLELTAEEFELLRTGQPSLPVPAAFFNINWVSSGPRG